MSEVGGNGDGRKRSRNTPLSSQLKKKARKKSPIALRALALLESDSSSDDERDAKDYRPAERTAPSLAGETRIPERSNDDSSAAQCTSAIHLNEDVASVQPETRIPLPPSVLNNIREDGKARSNSFAVESRDGDNDKSGLNDAAREKDHAAVSKHDLPSTTEEVHPHINEVGRSRVTRVDISSEVEVAAETDAAEKRGNEDSAAVLTTEENHLQNNEADSSSIAKEAAESVASGKGGNEDTVSVEDAVRPHAQTSHFSDVLTSFLSTPFDDKAMLSLHQYKEASEPDRKKMTGRKGSFKRWALSQWDYVPIIPQKAFLRSTRKMRIESAMHQEQECLRNGMTHETNPLSAAAISAEVTTFLMQEGQNLINSRQQASLQDRASTQLQQNQQLQQPTQLPQTQQLRVQQYQQMQIQQAQIMQQQIQQSQTQQLIPHKTHQQASNNFGFTQHQHSYFPMSMANTYNNISQFGHGYQQRTNWQYPQPYAAPAFPPGSVQNAYNNAAFSAVAQTLPSATTTAPVVFDGRNSLVQTSSKTTQPQIDASQPTPKFTAASNEIKLTNSNRDNIAKFPVAFGFGLNDLASKKIAETAAKEWLSQGKNAQRDSDQRNSDSKGKKNSSPHARTGSGTPTKPRTPATLVSSGAASDLPPGWIAKTFQRNTGKTVGTRDTYFYSPQCNIKFRSMTNVKNFLRVLSEPGINGREDAALKVCKERGNKF